MQGIRKELRRFVADESGATAVEYGLLLGLMALAILGSITAMSNSTNAKFETLSTEMDTAGT